MPEKPPENVRISFEGSLDGDMAPMVVVYNPVVFSSSLLTQVKRFGLVSTGSKSLLSGRLKGNRKDFMDVIQSYGVAIEIVPAV